MTSPTITDADRRCAGTVLGITETPVPVATFDVIMWVIAAHREQARRDALEEAARVASAERPHFHGGTMSFVGHVCAPIVIADYARVVPGRFNVGWDDRDPAIAMLNAAYDAGYAAVIRSL